MSEAGLKDFNVQVWHAGRKILSRWPAANRLKLPGSWRFQGRRYTLKPGLYIAPDSDAPREYRGIGVRIEDDILVTRDGHRNLSGGIPSAAEELEAIVRG